MQQTLSTLRAEKGYYTTRELAEYFGVTSTTICNWLRKGWLAGDKTTDGGKDAKHERRRWHVWPGQIEDMHAREQELIEASRRYWVRTFVKMRA